MEANAAEYGFANTVSTEPWHYSYTRDDAPTSSMSRPYPEGSNVAPGGGGGGATPVATSVSEGESVLGQDTYMPNGSLLKDGETLVLRYQASPGVFVEWAVTDQESLANSGYDAARAIAYTPPTSGKLIPYQEAGNAAEIGSLVEAGYQDLQSFFNDTISLHFPPWHPHRSSPDVAWLTAKLMANPDAEEAVFESWYNSTDLAATVNAKANEWNDITPAERDFLTNDMAWKLTQEYFDKVGQRIDSGHGQMQAWASQIASGELTWGQVVDQIEDHASQFSESPFSRVTREEVIASRQFGIDGEDIAQRLRTLANQWGVQLTDGTLNSWSSQVQNNVDSMADFQEQVKDWAQTLYPNKDREMRTSDWAEPWVQTYQRTLESGAVDVLNPKIQQALQGGVNTFEFERQLMATPEWQETTGFRDSYTSALSQASRQMGFS